MLASHLNGQSHISAPKYLYCGLIFNSNYYGNFQELGGLQQENANLRAELEKLRSSKNELEQRFEQHLAICRHVHR